MARPPKNRGNRPEPVARAAESCAALRLEKEVAEAPWAELSVRTLRPTREIEPLSETQETRKNRRICRTGIKVSAIGVYLPIGSAAKSN